MPHFLLVKIKCMLFFKKKLLVFLALFETFSLSADRFVIYVNNAHKYQCNNEYRSRSVRKMHSYDLVLFVTSSDTQLSPSQKENGLLRKTKSRKKTYGCAEGSNRYLQI